MSARSAYGEREARDLAAIQSRGSVRDEQKGPLIDRGGKIGKALAPRGMKRKETRGEVHIARDPLDAKVELAQLVGSPTQRRACRRLTPSQSERSGTRRERRTGATSSIAQDDGFRSSAPNGARKKPPNSCETTRGIRKPYFDHAQIERSASSFTSWLIQI
jgi:hypothetical protein